MCSTKWPLMTSRINPLTAPRIAAICWSTAAHSCGSSSIFFSAMTCPCILLVRALSFFDRGWYATCCNLPWKNHADYTITILLGGSIWYWGSRIQTPSTTQNSTHDRLYNAAPAGKRLVLHSWRGAPWRASWTGTRTFKNDDGGLHHRHQRDGQTGCHARARSHSFTHRHRLVDCFWRNVHQ